jgi:indolepyruvate ferredoxin oxidoreductase, alpha subunit
MLLLGDEACASGAIDAGLSVAYGYPGTPSTEIMEYLIDHAAHGGGIVAKWCSNEKTAYEGAMGVSYAGRRSLVTMKHVGLNVAFDAFVNSVQQHINGGLVVAVADDPGMHSSQNEQDTRCLADFAKTVCFEPRSQQEAYDMTREAFDVSERFHIPVVIRLVTRLAHARSIVVSAAARKQNSIRRATVIRDWMCVPSSAHRNYHRLVAVQPELALFSGNSRYNTLRLNPEFTGYGVITTGLAGNYFREMADRLSEKPSHLHIGQYPVPVNMVVSLGRHVERLVVIEEGYPFVEGKIRSVIGDPMQIQGKMDGFLPYEGELNTDIVGKTLNVKETASPGWELDPLPVRLPQLCKGCPHHDTFALLREIVNEYDDTIITSDIGCYSLGALPPYEIIDTALCMGASIGMAKGAVESGYPRVIATIGDGTFLHSGLPGLVDAVTSDVPMVLMILDNSITAMTGGQKTIMNSGQIVSVVAGTGVSPDHLHVIVPLPKYLEENTALLRRELNHEGLSVIIAQRECVQALKKRTGTP